VQKAEREAAAATTPAAGASADKGKAPMQTQVSLSPAFWSAGMHLMMN